MKHFIEDYREHKIWYNEDTDKFTVELLVDDNWREKGRKSLKECKQAIDSHIKENLEFRPIICFRKAYSLSDGDKVKIEQVRADGGFIMSDDDSDKKRTEISEVLEQLRGNKVVYFNYDANYMEWLFAKEKLKERQLEEMKHMNSKEPKLTPLDLSFVKQFIKP